MLHSAFTRDVVVRMPAKEKLFPRLKINSEVGARFHTLIANETMPQISPDFSLALRRSPDGSLHRAPSAHYDVVPACGSSHHARCTHPRTSHELAAVDQSRLSSGMRRAPPLSLTWLSF